MKLPTTVVIHNWRRKTNKSGVYPVHLRIAMICVQKYDPIPIPAKISKEQWLGEDDNWVRDDHPFYFEINNKIRERKQLVQNLIKRYYMADKTITFSDIFMELKSAGHSKNLNLFFAEYIRRPTAFGLKASIPGLISVIITIILLYRWKPSNNILNQSLKIL